MEPLHNANRRLALKLGAGALAMFGFGYALVPFYDSFCRLTGLNGRSDGVASEGADPRWVTVEFNGDVMPGLPWHFEPEKGRLRVHPGERVLTHYRVKNLADRSLEGQAVPSITPPAAARHFNKIECFCFTRQRLRAGEEREMPVIFVVGRELPAEVGELTLSYAFFPFEGGKK